MATNEYLISLVEQAKEHLPAWLFNDLHKVARARAGGQRRGISPSPAGGFEKIAIPMIRPETISELSSDELLSILSRLNELFESAKKKGEATENYVNAAIFVVDELEGRGAKFNGKLPIVLEISTILNARTPIVSKILKSPAEVMVVPNFVSIAGSAVSGKEYPQDIDIVYRANRDVSDNYLIAGQNVRLPMRKIIDTEKECDLHHIDNPQGPHSDNIPIYDLVLRRRKDLRVELIKSEDLENVDGEVIIKLEGEGDTRAEDAEKFWRENWWKIFPESGKGRFVYQQHYRGLSEDEIGSSRESLLDSDHSLHGDLRFEARDGTLWGFTTFIGKTSDNKKAGGDRLISLKGEQKIQGQFKLQQPKEWLRVGRPSPLVVPPGGPGAESKSYAKFFALDSGDYEMGVWRKNAVEVFLKGDKLKGKLVIQFAPSRILGRRQWMVSRPEGQEPIAEERDLTSEVSELKRKGQKYLVWARPGVKPRLINVDSFVPDSEKAFKVCKVEAAKKVVTGIVHDPYIVDAHNDWIPPNIMEDIAFDWMEKSRKIKIGHKKSNDKVVPVEVWVERYPTVADYKAAIAGKPHDIYRFRYGNDFIHSGSWVLSVRVNDEKILQDIISGKINAFSLGGEGTRNPVDRSKMPKVKNVIEIDGSAINVKSK